MDENVEYRDTENSFKTAAFHIYSCNLCDFYLQGEGNAYLQFCM
jgi:hypothetical protein